MKMKEKEFKKLRVQLPSFFRFDWFEMEVEVRHRLNLWKGDMFVINEEMRRSLY